MEYRGPGLRMPAFLRNVREGAVAIVVVEGVGIAGEPARTAHHRDSFPLAIDLFLGWNKGRRVQVDVVADEKVEVAVAIVVEPCTACSPMNFFAMETGLLGDIGEGAVAIIVKQNVVAPGAAEEIVPAVVVIIADANAGLPASTREPGFFGDVGERSVAIIFVEMRGWRFSSGPFGVEPRSIGQINIQPAIIVVVEKSDATALGFDDVAFAINSAPHVGDGQAGFLRDVYERDRRNCGIGRN